MRDAVPPCEMRRRGEAGRRTRTPPQQPSGRGGPARADRHRNLHAPRLQNHPPRITFRRSGSIRDFATDLNKRRRCGPRDGQHGSRRRPLGAPDAETCTSHSKVQFQPSFSSAKRTPRVQNAHLDEEGAGRPGGSREGQSTGYRIPDAAPRARRTARPSHRLPSRHRPSRRRNPTRSRHAARRSDGLSPPMPDRAGFITLTG